VTPTISYRDATNGITASQLQGFFVGWPRPPSAEAHLRMLQGSDVIVLAIDTANGAVVGFVTALSDGVTAAYVPHLEVLPAYQGQGIGTALMEHLLARLRGLYMIDLLCDPDVQPFYERLGMRRATGMFIRDDDRQSSAATTANG